MEAPDSRPRVYTVSELTGEIQDLLEQSFSFVWVEGEISNFSSPVSGHYYMSLKDEGAQLKTVMFRPQIRYLKFVPEDGMKVIARGRIGVYAPRGDCQLILDYLEPVGVGALALAFEQLKKKLAAQGLFDREIKRPLPFLPKRIAVITSPTGAAIRDFLKVVKRRFANLEIIVLPVRVQGEEACGEIVAALGKANRELEVDLIVLTRGGGSLEDLWAFNREELALAIRESPIPVVSAVGHEIDLTISDLVADLRAPTPSAAAELIIREKETLRATLADITSRMVSEIRHIVTANRQTLDHLKRGLKDPRRKIDDAMMRLDDRTLRLTRALLLMIREKKGLLGGAHRSLLAASPHRNIRNQRQHLEYASTSLLTAMKSGLRDRQTQLSFLVKRTEDLGPISVLKRGYSITRKSGGGDILRDAGTARQGEDVDVILARGMLRCRVEESDPDFSIKNKVVKGQ